jgi:hypothetical protein
MILTIQKVEQEFTKTGAEYLKVLGVDQTGRQVTKSVFDNLADKWDLLEENACVELKLEQRGQFWNVVDILQPQTPPQTQPKILDEHQEVIEKVFKDDNMTKDDWAEKDRKTRKSIERQKSLELATNWCEACKEKGEEVKTTHIISIAKIFEAYLDGGADES